MTGVQGHVQGKMAVIHTDSMTHRVLDFGLQNIRSRVVAVPIFGGPDLLLSCG